MAPDQCKAISGSSVPFSAGRPKSLEVWHGCGMLRACGFDPGPCPRNRHEVAWTGGV